MTQFRQATLNEIKGAIGDVEVEKVIYASLERLQSKNVNGHFIKSYRTRMAVSLLNLKSEVLSSNSKENIKKALEIFRKLNRSPAEISIRFSETSKPVNPHLFRKLADTFLGARL